ncbi:hypothetical protein [Sulfurospirillum sp. 1612]|uniref:hypothetical protein n=1 Tax=Sulfurospirillum sp. 1612 TaxID=3094835 RepID=UPI002F91E9C5
MCMIYNAVELSKSVLPMRREKKKPATPFNKKLLEPDPNFKDERVLKSHEEKKGFFAKLLG